MEKGVEFMAEVVILKKDLTQQGAVKVLVRQKESLAKGGAYGQPAGSLRLKKLTADGIGAEPPGPADLTEIGRHGTFSRPHASGNGNHRP
jgi:hypothetical protein